MVQAREQASCRFSGFDEFGDMVESSLMKARNRTALKPRKRKKPEQAFPGEYVAYLERTGNGSGSNGRRLVAHGLSLKQLNMELAKLSPQERKRIVLHYCGEATPDTIEVHLDLPDR